jgi:hypothetical protein
MVTAAEFVSILGVTEDDVLQWMLAGRIPYVDGAEGEPRARIREEHSADGPLSSWSITYPMSRDPEELVQPLPQGWRRLSPERAASPSRGR